MAWDGPGMGRWPREAKGLRGGGQPSDTQRASRREGNPVAFCYFKGQKSGLLPSHGWQLVSGRFALFEEELGILASE